MELQSPKRHNTVNMDYGKLLLVDYILLIYIVIRIIVWELPKFMALHASRISHQEESSFGNDLKFFLIRTVNELLNYRQIRSLIRPDVSSILQSPRYRSHSKNLYHLVSRPSFAGYWILQSSITRPAPPRTSDLTIYFLHGGGYFTSQPGTYLLFLLRLAESLLEQGVSVSILALDYHLAPEHVFPAQVKEATVAYEYLIHEMQIAPSKILVAGDSAGAHLALSFLVNLQKPYVHPTYGTEHPQLPKPNGLILLSPWLSLHHKPLSFTTNAKSDVLSASFLHATALRFLGTTAISEADKSSPYLEFINPWPPIDWNVVLPSWIWVSAGSNEILFDDVVVWVDNLEKKLGSDRVSWEWRKGEVHDWQWLETMDEGSKKKFLNKPAEERGKGEFEAIARIGEAIGFSKRGQVGAEIL